MSLSRPWRRVVIAAVLCALPAAVPAAPGGPGAGATAKLKRAEPKGGDPKVAFERYTLPNGLEVILAPDRRVPIVAVNLWYHVGSGHEVYGRSGFAHLFEHMVFQGSKNVGSDRHFEVLRKIGGDSINGTTNSDRTNYFEVVPSNQLEAALWLESDRMGYLLDPSTFTKKSLDNQIDVVRNERRQRIDNMPYGKALFAQYAALYPEGHPYRYLTIGKHEDLVAAAVDDVKAFFRTWYVPANATLTLVGDIDVPAARKLIEKWFATFPKSAKPKAVVVPAPVTRAAEVMVTDDDFAKLRRVTFAWHSPANYGEGDAELDVVAAALDEEGPGRLYRALVYDRPLAQSVSAGQGGASFSGIFSVSVTLRSEASLDEVKRIVAAEIARVTKEPLAQKEIARVVANNEARGVRALETVLGRANVLQGYNHYLGEPDRLTWDLDRYRTTTAEKIRATAAKYLVPDGMVTVITIPARERQAAMMARSSTLIMCLCALAACGSPQPTTVAAPAAPVETAPAPVAQAPAPTPQKEVPVPAFEKVPQTAAPQELVFPDEAFRKQQPKAGAPRPFRLPAVKPFRLKNGVQAYLVEQHELPIVSMDLNFDGGAMTDPKGKEGLASVCMAMLTEGTAKLDKIQYAEALADVASNINTYTTDDATGLTLSSLRKHLDATFALFAETLRTPGLRASDFDRMVKRRIESVKQARGTPAAVAGRVTGPVLFGLDHPFAGVVTEATLAAITLEDCRRYASTYLTPGAARLFIVGDLTEAEVRAYFEGGELAAWTGAPAKLGAVPAPSGPPGRIFFVDVPGAAQSQVSMLHGGPQRTAPDYFATTMMASVFGGSFTSRINMNLREEKGYSYGARGGFGYTKQYGTFNASASVQADATYQTVLELAREVKELSSGARPVQKEELEREKQGVILGLPSQFATAQAALGNYRRLVYFGLPLDYYNSYVARVGQVNEAQVKAAAAKHLRPGQAVYLVVGDGNAKVIVGVPKKEVDPDTKQEKTLWTREPYRKDGKQLTLREALVDLAARGDVGAGGLVELDRDGRPKPAP